MTVIFKENKVLMVQEAKKECNGYWYLPAGRLEPNERLIVSFSCLIFTCQITLVGDFLGPSD
jgi:8-oxo-dGTP pyrophosphatase MutT (NUDIX family)